MVATVVLGTDQLVPMTVAAWALFVIWVAVTGGLAAVWEKFPQYTHIGVQPSSPEIGWGLGFLGICAAGVMGPTIFTAAANSAREHELRSVLARGLPLRV
jgi:Na+/proline symporter